MVDLLIPIGRRMPVAYGNPQGVVNSTRAVVLRNKSDIANLGEIFGGRNAKPRQEIIVVGPDGRTPIMVVGLGVTEVAELEDVINEGVDRAKEKIKKYGTQMPFEEYRERHGLPRSEDFGTLFAEAVERRINEHKRNPRTNPARKPFDQFAKGKSQVTTPNKDWVKES